MSRLSLLAALICGLIVPSFAQAQSRNVFGSGNRMGQNSGFGGQNTGFGGQSAGGFGGQNSGGFGGTGSSSGINNGGSMFGAGGGMFGNTGAAAFGGSSVSGGSGGMGTGGGIQTGLDLGGYGGPVGQNPFVGMVNQNGGFVGDRRIGSGQLGAGAYGGGGFGQSGFGGFGGRGGFDRGGFDRGGDNDWRGGDSWWGDRGEEQRQSIRPTIRIGFEVESGAPTVSRPEFEQRYSRIVARTPKLAGIEYEADGAGRVVLSGTVPNEEARDLAIALFRLEPGVSQVVDDMTIATPPYE